MEIMNTEENNTFTDGFCKCGNKQEEDHHCPYNQEVNGDLSPCNCCSVCTEQCCQDI